jgi:hypothetical protein
VSRETAATVSQSGLRKKPASYEERGLRQCRRFQERGVVRAVWQEMFGNGKIYFVIEK